jgi:UDP-N-acetyl-alpha-D-muramoyl-L-alanyl-L-glutamate epimerase
MKTLILKKITAKKQTIRYHYSFNEAHFVRGHDFNNTINFDDFLNDQTFVRLLSYSAIADSIYTFGLGYYDEIHLPFSLDDIELAFFEKVFLNGLAEFRYVNNLPIHQTVKFSWDDAAKPIADGTAHTSTRLLDGGAFVLNGGGKDGAVAIEMAKQLEVDLAWFTSGAAESRSRIVDVSGINQWVQAQRYSDRYIKEHAILKGHRPMSFYVSMISSLAAYCTDRRYVIAANEYSASFPNIEVDGFWVNHQYSKSSEYEQSLSALFEQHDIPVRYFSITRPLYELQIMRIFAQYTKYHAHFLSCNRGMRDDVWCMNCPKCAFVIGSMYLYNESSAKELWGNSRDVFAANHLVDELVELVNVDAKPLECIGTIAENRLLVSEMVARELIVLNDTQRTRLDELMMAGNETEVIDLDAYERSGYFPPELADDIKNIVRSEMKEV